MSMDKKPRDIAVAYSIQKQAKRKKMARGGELDLRDERMSSIDDKYDDRDEDMIDRERIGRDADHDAKMERRAMLADGGMVDELDDEDEESRSIVDAIRRKMAKGGEIEDEVDLQDSNGDEDLNEEDDLSFKAARKKTYYDLDQLEDQPEDSNLYGEDEDDDHDLDVVSQIRRKMKKKI